MRRLLVDSDLLGTSYEIDRGPYRLRLTLPSVPAEEEDDDPTLAELAGRFPERDEFPLVARGLRTTATVSMKGIPWITTLRVECFFDGEVSADDFAEETNDRSALDAALDALHEAEHAARETVGRLLESVRLRGQHWLGPDAASPRGLGRSEIDDLDGGRRLPVSSSSVPTVVLTRIQEHQVLDAARLDEELRVVRVGTPPSLDDVLRSDSLFMLQDADPPDFTRSVITAAIACEVKVKRTLRSSATYGTQRELVELLLENPRDWSLALLALFDKPLKIICGRSLREDDKELFKRLDSLIRRRNGLVHKEEDAPDEDEAREYAQTAAAVFRWLNSL
jgi:hypothetical protein